MRRHLMSSVAVPQVFYAARGKGGQTVIILKGMNYDELLHVERHERDHQWLRSEHERIMNMLPKLRRLSYFNI